MSRCGCRYRCRSGGVNLLDERRRRGGGGGRRSPARLFFRLAHRRRKRRRMRTATEKLLAVLAVLGFLLPLGLHVVGLDDDAVAAVPRARVTRVRVLACFYGATVARKAGGGMARRPLAQPVREKEERVKKRTRIAGRDSSLYLLIHSTPLAVRRDDRQYMHHHSLRRTVQMRNMVRVHVQLLPAHHARPVGGAAGALGRRRKRSDMRRRRRTRRSAVEPKRRLHPFFLCFLRTTSEMQQQHSEKKLPP